VHAADVEGGFDELKGKKIGLVYLDATRLARRAGALSP
jgi:hypothetical protein